MKDIDAVNITDTSKYNTVRELSELLTCSKSSFHPQHCRVPQHHRDNL